MTVTLPPLGVDLPALETRLEHVPERPLSLAECQTLKAVVHTFADVLRLLDEQGATIARLRAFLGWTRSEKTREVLRQAGLDLPPTSALRDDGSEPATGQPRPRPDPGHGRHGVAAYAGAHRIAIAHPSLHSGDHCPGCAKGRVYAQDEPRCLVRIVGQAPLAATVYALDRLRCNLCGEVFAATPPPGVGPEKYDATSASMIALLKYGSGLPFNRLERLQAHLAIPLPASTQWEIVAETATGLRPTLDELQRQAAQGDVLHIDDTHMRVLGLRQHAASAAGETEEAPPDPANAAPDMAKRTGVFTSSIVSQTKDGHRIALFFTGRRHAGENAAAVLARRAAELDPPIQMSDALTRNLPAPLQVIVANCLAHGRRRFVEVTPQFPAQCRHVLEALGDVYRHDVYARTEGMTPQARLQYHQAHSGPVMTTLPPGSPRNWPKGRWSPTQAWARRSPIS
jgi:transposase